MKFLLSLILCLPLHLFAKETIIDKRENYFLTSTESKIASNVNPITGEYFLEETDLVIAGSQPLSLRRFYNHFAPYDPRYASWRYNPESFFVSNFEWQEQEIFASVGEADGSVSLYKRQGSQYYNFAFEMNKKFLNFSSNGQTHPLNTRIQNNKVIDPDNKKRFGYKGVTIDGSGRKRLFSTELHTWLDYVCSREKKKYIEDKIWIRPNVWTPYNVHIDEERLPNGNIICYTYKEWKYESKYPKPDLLSSIVAFNSNKSKKLGSLQFDYTRDKNEVSGLQVEGSDLRKVSIKHSGKSPIVLSSAQRPGQPSLSYGFQGGAINRVEKPEGRIITTAFDGTGKVTAQYAPFGPNGEMYPIARYEYRNRETIVKDAEDQKTIYRFDENKKITAFEVYQDNNLIRIDRFTWDNSTGNLLRKVIEDGTDKPIQITEYEYDKNQNPIVEKVGDGKEWRTISRTFSNDGFNLKLSETDRDGKLICYSYVPNTNLLSSELTYEGQTIRKRIFNSYDDCAICIRTIIDDGKTDDPKNLQGVTYRKIIEISPKQETPCFGLPEVVMEKTILSSGQEILLSKIVYTYTSFGKILKEDHYDPEGIHRYSICNEYDEKERLVATTDPLGNRTKFTYDANYNLISISGPKSGHYKEITYDKVNRPVRIADRQTDGSFLTIEKRYDKLGRVTEEVDECKNRTRIEYDALGRAIAIFHPDGAVECKTYDVLGNVIKEIDAKGYETVKTYNAFSQPLSISHPDGSEEHFVYNTMGSLKSYIDRNGAKTTYFYDIFDRPIKTEVYSSAGSLLKMTTTAWSSLSKLSETDAEGIKTEYGYDFAGRKVYEKTEDREIFYSYDALGRISKTQKSDTIYSEIFDVLGRPIEKRIETLSGTITFQERYAYDELGNRTDVVTSQGSTETLYNTRSLPIQIKDPLGHKTSISYSYQGQFIKTMTNPRNAQTVSIHDSRGREVETLHKDFRGSNIQQTKKYYDNNGNIIKTLEIVHEGTTPVKDVFTEWVYGPNNRLERLLESSQKETNYLYDEKGRLKTLINPDKTEIHHRYDDLGRIARFYSKDFDYRYSYDKNDRILKVEDQIAQQIMERTYDEYGNLIKETLGNGLQIQSHYDPQGQRILLSLPNGETVTFDYMAQQLSRVGYKGNSFEYTSRNLEGKPTRMTLPHSLGTISIEWDALSRWKHFSSPYFTSSLDYDSVGNLTKNAYKDLLGTKTDEYSYDYLNQVLEDSQHTYWHDSLYNRCHKDGIRHTSNPLCQITHDGARNYSYDANGNLISDGASRFEYDTQNRLIKVTKDNLRVEYLYDAFNRRLSKKIFHDNKLLKTFHYLWDGNNEIGAVVDDQIVQLRILGEGLGAEIGTAALFELNGQLFVPIHDHRGSLVTLVDLSANPLETYRYTAFGEELTNGTFSPWRFSSKRVDPETGWIYFGRRYYCPSLGRWTTPDPQGFADGPNLYAYVSNCPMNHIDLYGLMMWEGSYANSLSPRYDRMSQQLINRSFQALLPFNYSLANLPAKTSWWKSGGLMALSFAELGTWALMGPARGGFSLLEGTYQLGKTGYQAWLSNKCISGLERMAGVGAKEHAASNLTKQGIWTSSKRSTAVDNAYYHFKQHGIEFNSKNSLDYVKQTLEFFRNPSKETLTKVRPNGDVVRYDPVTNTFGVMDKSGTPRTMFKPNPELHGLETNLEYFNAQ